MSQAKIYCYASNLTPEKSAILDECGQIDVSETSHSVIPHFIQPFMPGSFNTNFIDRSKISDTDDILVTNNIYVKHDLEIKLKIELDQENRFKPLNYCLIQNDNERVYCYFIVDKVWTSAKCVTLSLRMDTINTFVEDIFDTNTDLKPTSIDLTNTTIIRAHEDRFYKRPMPNVIDPETYTDFKLNRKVSDTTEDVPTFTQFRKTSTNAFTRGQKWYITFWTETDTSAHQSIRVRVFPENSGSCAVVEDETPPRTLYNLVSFKFIDRSSTDLLKVIELPYGPFGYVSTDNNIMIRTDSPWDLMQYNNLFCVTLKTGLDPYTIKYYADLGTFKFPDMNIKITDNNELSSAIVTKRSRQQSKKLLRLESKLKHSNFNECYLTYDSFQLPIRHESMKNSFSEAMQDAYDPSLFVTYYQSTNLGSTCMFEVTNGPSTDYKWASEYENYLVANRNNEVPVYTNAYLEYVNNGYNYDKKLQDLSEEKQYVNNLIGIGQQGVGIATSIATENIAGAISGTTNLLFNGAKTVNNMVYNEYIKDVQWQKKFYQMKQAKATTSGSDDLSLFNIYGKNELRYYEAEINDGPKKTIYNLFNLTGYSINQPDSYKKYIATRRCFNYLQLDVVWNDTAFKSEMYPFIQDIKNRLNSGVTIYHWFYNGTDYMFDWNQEYENWETWICPPKNY